MKKTSILAIGAPLMLMASPVLAADSDAPAAAPAAATTTAAPAAAGTATAKHHHHHHHSTKTADQKAGTKTTPKGMHHHKHMDHAMAHPSMHMQSHTSDGNGYNPTMGGANGAGGTTAQ